jgi:predicted nucleic acid-binding protein
VNEVFADTFYWIAIFDPKESAHEQAAEQSRLLRSKHLVTTELVLIEVLNHFSGYGPYWRDRAARLVEQIIDNEHVVLVPHTPLETLERSLVLYRARLDKAYSLTDCVSMLTMRERNIYEVLTQDRHFAQEGFTLLL